MSETRVSLGNRTNGTLVKTADTGAAALSATFTAVKACRLMAVTVKFSAAPTTSEALTITLDAVAGAAYDVVLYTLDPSGVSATSLLVSDEHFGDVWLVAGDKITVAYTNTDTRTYGVQMTILEAA